MITTRLKTPTTQIDLINSTRQLIKQLHVVVYKCLNFNQTPAQISDEWIFITA